MAARHWVGGSAVWNATAGTKWALTQGGAGGQLVPTTSDNVYLDDTSNPTITQSGSIAYSSLAVTNGTFTVSAAVTSAKTVTVNGGTLVASYSMGADIFVVSSGTLTFQTATNKSIGNLTVSGGTVNINIDAGAQATTQITHTGGTIQIADTKTLFASIYTSSGTTARTLTFTNTATLLLDRGFAYIGSGMTVNEGTGLISVGNNASLAAPISFGGNGETYYDMTLVRTGNNATGTLSGANTFHNLSLSTAAFGYGMNFDADQIITGTLTTSATYYYLPFIFKSSSAGTPRTITAHAVSISKTIFTDITWAGDSSPLPNSGEYTPISGCTNIGNIVERYWKAGSANWATENWYTTSGGSTKAVLPQASNDAYFNGSSNATAYTITMTTAATCHNLSFAAPGTSGDVTWAGSSTVAISGNLTLYSTLIRTYTGIITFNSTTSQTITSATVGLASAATFNGIGGVWQLQDDFTTTGTVTLTNGTIDVSGKKLSANIFSSNNSNSRSLIDTSTGGIVSLAGNAGTIISMATMTGFSVTNPPTMVCAYAGVTGTRTLNLGGTAGATESNSLPVSVTAGGDIVTTYTNGTTYVNNFDLTGFGGTFTIGQSFSIYGDAVLPSGITYSASAYGFAMTGTGTKTLTTGGSGLTLNMPITFNNAASTFRLGSDLTLDATRTLNPNNGAFTCVNGLNNYALSVGEFSANTGVHVTLGSATHLLTGTGTVFLNGGTMEPTTGTLKIIDTGATNITFSGFNGTYNNVWFSRGTSTGGIIIAGSNTFADFKDDGSIAHQITLTNSTTQTVTTFSVSGNPGQLIKLRNSSSTTHASLTKAGGGVIDCYYLDVDYITGNPDTTWYMHNSLDGGHNTRIHFIQSNNSNFFIFF